MLSYQQALNKIISLAKKKIIVIPISQSFGYIAAEDIYSKKDNPSYDNSLLDGYAVKSKDVKKNKVLSIIGSLAAGQHKKITYTNNSCIQIATGCPILHPYDAMIPYEQTIKVGSTITCKTNVRAFENVRKKGSDYKKNSLIFKKGTLINPQHLLAAKTMGAATIKVYEKPKIVLFCSGDEITENPHNTKKVINGMQDYIKSFQHIYKFDYEYLGIVRDNQNDLKKIYKKLQNSSGNTIIISTGGVSAGHKDFIPSMLQKHKYKIIFHKMLMQPGRPTLFATRNTNYYFGLPGNPISGIVGFHFLIIPLLQSILGRKNLQWKSGILTKSYNKNKKLTLFVRATNLGNKIIILPGQQSYKISTLVRANCWAMLDQKKRLVNKGEKVKYFTYEN
jgi:molybdopterin molybdotransferase